MCVCVGRVEEGGLLEGRLQRLLLPSERQRHGAISRLQRHKERHEKGTFCLFIPLQVQEGINFNNKGLREQGEISSRVEGLMADMFFFFPSS